MEKAYSKIRCSLLNLVMQNPMPIRTVTKTSVKKVGIENLDTGFRVLKLDYNNMRDVYYSAKESQVRICV